MKLRVKFQLEIKSRFAVIIFLICWNRSRDRPGEGGGALECFEGAFFQRGMGLFRREEDLVR